jgi:hypothetical protein
MMMRYLYILVFVIISAISFAQIDTLEVKKEGRFKVAGRVLKNSILSVPGDFSEMGKEISNDWVKTGLYAAGTLGLIAVDKYTTGFLHDRIEPNVVYSLPKIETFKSDIIWLQGNNLYMTYPIAGLYVGSFITNSEKGQRVAVNAVKAMTYSYVISHLLIKSAFARNRPHRSLNDNLPLYPESTRNPWDFGNYHPVYFQSEFDGTAFVSYHATTYFAIAKVFQMEYDNYWIPYTFATAVFLADIKSHNHWVSDLVVGGLVGTIIGRSVVKSSRKQNNILTTNKFGYKKFKMNKQFSPQISSALVGFQFVGTF